MTTNNHALLYLAATVESCVACVNTNCQCHCLPCKVDCDGYCDDDDICKDCGNYIDDHDLRAYQCDVQA